MKKYRLKNQVAQMTLDAVTNGEFTKELDRRVEVVTDLYGSLEQKEEDTGTAIFVEVKPVFARRLSVTLRCKDLEEVTE